MATPHLTRHHLDGALGPLLVDVRAGARAAGPAVVILHGFKGFKDWGMFPPFAERLARSGFTAVSYNTSGSGVDDEGRFSFPERFGRGTFSSDLHDLAVVLAALDAGALGVARPPAIALVGHSRGGGGAILGASRHDRVSALVTWSAVSTPHRWSAEVRRRWREAGRLDVTNQRTGEVLPLYPDVLDDLEAHADALDIEAAASRLAIPWLIIHGTADETVPFAEGKALAAAAPAGEFLPVEGAGHTYGAAHPFAGRTPALDRVFDASVAFLSRHLP
jgi:uncharacterized protein